jgi:hypothetical protein
LTLGRPTIKVSRHPPNYTLIKVHENNKRRNITSKCKIIDMLSVDDAKFGQQKSLAQ